MGYKRQNTATKTEKKIKIQWQFESRLELTWLVQVQSLLQISPSMLEKFQQLLVLRGV